jgi:hypothetical protein
LSGCVQKPSINEIGNKQTNGDLKKSFNEADVHKPHVVVAVCDLGINPYHEVFRRPNNTQPPWTYIPGFPKDAIALSLTFDGIYQENVEADKDTWAKVEKGKVYWIPYTCIAGAISFSLEENALDPIGYNLSGPYPILDAGMHGTTDASCVLEANPDATILMAQCGYRHYVNALQWVVNQSWIDVIIGDFGDNNGMGLPIHPEFYGVPKVSEQGWKAGKILISPAGNRPVAFIGQPESAPPAFISIGAGNKNARGETLIVSKMTDFITEWTHKHPSAYSVDGYDTDGACSWAAPYAAGTFSSIILKTRQLLNYTEGIIDGAFVKISEKNITITNQDVRSTVNKTAIYWNTTDYDASQNVVNTSNPSDTITSISIPVAPLPFLQMGWGYIGSEIVNDTVDILLGKKQYEPLLEKQIAEPYMDAVYELRTQIWANWPF